MNTPLRHQGLTVQDAPAPGRRTQRPEFFSYCFFVGLIATTFLV